MAKKSNEEYLGAIYKLTENGGSAKTGEIAKQLGIKSSSVTEMLNKLARKGYIKYEQYRGAVLTQKGKIAATKIKRKHRLLERFLHDVLGVRKSRVHKEACRLEHALSEDATDALDRVMDYPSRCPDDEKPIPQTKSDLKKNEFRLSNMEKGYVGKIKRFEGGRGFQLNLRSIGIREGKEVEIIAKEPMGGPVVVRTGKTTITIGRGMSSRIIVEVPK